MDNNCVKILNLKVSTDSKEAVELNESNQSSEFNDYNLSQYRSNQLNESSESNDLNESNKLDSLSQPYSENVIKQLDRIYHDELVRYALELKEHLRRESSVEQFQQIDKQMDWCLSQIEEDFNSIPKVVEKVEFDTLFEIMFPSIDQTQLQLFHQTKQILREKKIKAYLHYRELHKMIDELNKKQADQDLKKLQIRQEIFTIKQKFENLLKQSNELGQENAELVKIYNIVDNQFKTTFYEKKQIIFKLDQTVREMFDLELYFERSLNELYIEAVSSTRKAISDKRVQEREGIFAQVNQVQHNIDQEHDLIQSEKKKSNSKNKSPSNSSQLISSQTEGQWPKKPKKVLEEKTNDFNRMDN